VKSPDCSADKYLHPAYLFIDRHVMEKKYAGDKQSDLGDGTEAWGVFGDSWSVVFD